MRRRSAAGLGALAFVAMASAVLLLAAARPIRASGALSPTGDLPVKVIFTGNGTMTVDETYVYPASACIVSSNDTMALDWRSAFSGSLSDNGVLDVNESGTLEQGPGTFAITTTITQGDPSLEVPCESVTVTPCGGQIPTGAQPSFQLLLGSEISRPMVFEAQSATRGTIPAACQGPVQIELENDLTVLENALPGALAAHGELPAEALLNGPSYGVPVSYASAPSQVQGECTGGKRINAYILNDGCSASMTWNGMVTFALDCGAQNQSVDCFDKKTKEEAGRAAKAARRQAGEARLAYNIDCGGIRTDLSKMIDKGGGNLCTLEKEAYLSDFREVRHLRMIANDPPASAYTKVAKPHVPKVKDGQGLRRFFPASYRWLRGKLTIDALTGAVMTAQNRASGALAALSKGRPGAAAALSKQDKAVLSYAKQAAHLLGGQRRRARKAASELRRAASGLRGKGRRLAKGLRGFAAGIVSKQSVRGDKLAAAALRGIRG